MTERKSTKKEIEEIDGEYADKFLFSRDDEERIRSGKMREGGKDEYEKI